MSELKVLIVYDSVFGNTEKIAKAMGEALTSETRVARVGSVNPSEIKNYNVALMGSPTRGGRPTEAMQALLSKLTPEDIKGVRLASFDTRLSTRFVGIFGYAAGRTAEALKKLGVAEVIQEAFYVKGREGPLKEGELERAAEWAKKVTQ